MDLDCELGERESPSSWPHTPEESGQDRKCREGEGEGQPDLAQKQQLVHFLEQICFHLLYALMHFSKDFKWSLLLFSLLLLNYFHVK